MDNFLTGRSQNLDSARKNPNFRFIEQDVCLPIPESKVEFLSSHGLAGVLHFACPASPVDFEKIPFEILSVDSIGTAHTVDLARKHGARYIIASTSEIYGDPLVHPQSESYWGNVNPNGPRACYDEAKRFAEAYVTTAMRGTDKVGPINAAILRIFNTYGPRNRPDDGRVVPQLCIQALRGEDLSIFGDGTQTRSFCYVSDLIDGIVRLFESDLNEPVNIGNPVEYRVLDFAEALLRITGSRSKIRLLPARPDDPRKRCPDITKARTRLGWEPKVSLDQGLAQTLEYFRRYV